MTPEEKFTNACPGSRKKSNGKYECYTSSGIKFDWWPTDDGTVRMKVWNDTDYRQVLAEVGLTPSDMYPANKKGKAVSKEAYAKEKLTLPELAEYLALPWKFLFHHGFEDEYRYKNVGNGYSSIGVKMGGYCYPDGRVYERVRVRLSLTGKRRFVTDENTPGNPIPCGLHLLHEAREKGYLFLSEGESDWLTFTFHGFPCLGIPGASNVRSLDVSLLKGIPRIYITVEPDQAKKSQNGEGFYRNVRDHLRAQGYEGEIYFINWKPVTGTKDPSALHKALCVGVSLTDEPRMAEVMRQFAAAIEKAIAEALPEGICDLMEYIPPDDPEPELFIGSGLDHRTWVRELNARPAEIMTPTHKVVHETIMEFAHWYDAAHHGWFKVDTPFLAHQAGVSTQAFLDAVAYLTDMLGLYVKRHVTYWRSEMDAPKKECHKELFIHPAPQARFDRPSTIHIINGQPERKKAGGKQTPKAKCVHCQSENVNEHLFKVFFCRDCHKMHQVQLDDHGTGNLNEDVRVNVKMTLIESNSIEESKRQNDIDSHTFLESEPESSPHEYEGPPPMTMEEMRIVREIALDTGQLYVGKPCTAQRRDGNQCGCTLSHMLDGHVKCCLCEPGPTWSKFTMNQLRSLFQPNMQLGA